MNTILSHKREHFRNTFSNLHSNNFGGVDEYVTIPDNPAFSFTDGAGNDLPFSVFCWINVSAFPNNCFLFTKSQNSSLGNEWSLWYRTTGDVVAAVQTATAGNHLIGRLTAAGKITTGTWIHVGFTYNASKAASGIKIYVNAVQSDTTNNNVGTYTGMVDTTTVVRISHPVFPMAGKVAAPVIINKELSAAEVTELYNAKMTDLRNTSVGGNLVFSLCYPNGQADFNTWTDYSGNGHNGTMTNQENTDIDSDVPS